MLTLDVYQSWDDSHEETQYPFADEASLISADGAARLPAGVLIDAVVGARDITATVYVSELLVKAAAVTITFAQNGAPLATATVTASSADWLPLVSAVPNVLYAGKVKVSAARVGALFEMGLGTHLFAEDATPLVPYSVFLSPATGVTGISLPSGEVLTGDITLFLGSGIDADMRADGAVVLKAVGLPFNGRGDSDALRRGIRSVDLSVRSASGAAATATLYPSRGAIGAMTDHSNSARSPAIVINGSGAEISVEVAQ